MYSLKKLEQEIKEMAENYGKALMLITALLKETKPIARQEYGLPLYYVCPHCSKIVAENGMKKTEHMPGCSWMAAELFLQKTERQYGVYRDK